VGVLGDVCRNVEGEILPYSDDLMSLLIQNLGKDDVHRNIKPQILSTFGDVALVVGEWRRGPGCLAGKTGGVQCDGTSRPTASIPSVSEVWGRNL
jgi:hypothetical protein